MATTEAAPRSRERLALYVLGGLALGAVGLVLYGLLSRPAQMGTSEEVFNTVDALYTAVRNRDEKRVCECEQRLCAYCDAGKLPRNAADELASIIRKAKSGSWESAAERLYEFMLAQRREGTLEHHHDHDKKAKSAPTKGKGK
jgi:hypothetical protein